MSPEKWRQTKKILDDVLARAPDQRPAFLRAACGADAEIRREIEALLEFEEQEESFLENPVFNFETPAFKENTPDDLIGRAVGKYEIVRKIGTGGMGTVFLAARTGGEFRQQVAVKIIKNGINSQETIRRFQQERQILATLEHQFIARLIDGGNTADGVPYFVMEYVEGLPITQYAAEKKLGIEARLDLFRQVCQAVAYAHQHLVVHRDLKPSNILITDDGTPKLLDFGIAKLLKEQSSGETNTEMFAFTPEYASPEQLRGENLTTATDIYSLGVVLYELLTGTRPFQNSEQNIGRLISAVTTGEPLKPSLALNKANELQAARKEMSSNGIRGSQKLNGDLDNIILKALRKEPERRYSSVEKFSDDIRRHLEGLPVSARPDTFGYRAEKFFQRNRLAVIASLTAVFSLIGGIFAVGYQARIADAERAVAQRRFNEVRQLANSFVFEINDEIDKSPIKARELLVTRAVEYLDKLAQEAERDATLQSELAAAYEKIGDVQVEIFKPGVGNSAGALENQRKALKMREKLFADDEKNVYLGMELAKSYIKTGDVLALTGDITTALENYRGAVALNEKMLAREPQNIKVEQCLSRSYLMLGQAVLRSGALSESLQNYEKALAINQARARENLADSDSQRRVAVTYSYIGYVRLEMGDFATALQNFQDALAIERQVSETDGTNFRYRRNVSSAYSWVGVALRELGKNDESAAQIERARQIQEEIFDTDRQNFGEQNALADCYAELGMTFARAGKTVAAVQSYERAIANYTAVANADAQNVHVRRQINFTRRHLADALAESGKPKAALEIYAQTLAFFQELTAKDVNNTEWQNDLAVNYLKIGETFLKSDERLRAAENFALALPLYEKLVDQSPEHSARRRDLQTVKNHLAKIN